MTVKYTGILQENRRNVFIHLKKKVAPKWPKCSGERWWWRVSSRGTYNPGSITWISIPTSTTSKCTTTIHADLHTLPQSAICQWQSLIPHLLENHTGEGRPRIKPVQYTKKLFNFCPFAHLHKKMRTGVSVLLLSQGPKMKQPHSAIHYLSHYPPSLPPTLRPYVI